MVETGASNHSMHAGGDPENPVSEGGGDFSSVLIPCKKQQLRHDKRVNSHPSPIPVPTGDDEFSRYSAYPLLRSLLKHEKLRDAHFCCDGYDQFAYPKGNGGWMITLCVLRGRALHNIFLPWLFVSLHSVIIVLVFELSDATRVGRIEEAVGDWSNFYGLVLNVVLSFLLVFRLNRAAARYWEAREHWGILIALGRALTGGILNYGGHNPSPRDDAIRWVAASSVYVMAFMRGQHEVPEGILGGILSKAEMDLVHSVKHTPLYTTDRVRESLQRMFHVYPETPQSLAYAWTIQRDRLEGELVDFTRQFGAMERIRATPLPIVYVTHLRTFLLIHLFLFPYAFVFNQKWATIPLTMVTAFAFLGIEGASMEVENPFKKGHVNNLNQDAFSQALIQNIQQQVQTKADLEESDKNKC